MKSGERENVRQLAVFHRLPPEIQNAVIEKERAGEPQEFSPPEVIDAYSPEGLERLGELAKKHFNTQQAVESTQILEPFFSARQEFLDLRQHFIRQLQRFGLSEEDTSESVAERYRNDFIEQVQRLAQTKNKVISQKRLQQLTQESLFFSDLARLSSEFVSVPATEDFSEHSQLIWEEEKRTLSVFISQEIDARLKKTRMVGLIPFESLNKLRSMKIVVIGASVAAATIDLLVALGAQNITIIDYGDLAPSNGPRSPSGPSADYKSNGTSKVKAVQKSAYQRNPFGNYVAIHGRAVAHAEEKQGSYDVTYEELITSDVDLVIEVVDSARTKIGLRLWMQGKFPTIPLLWMADVGNHPFAGLELPGDGKHFNQVFSSEQLEFLHYVATNQANLLESLKSLFLMVKSDLPDDHMLQVLGIYLSQFTPFLSQIPNSARGSAEMAAGQIIKHLQGAHEIGSNKNKRTAPLTLMPPLSRSAQKTLREIFKLIIT